MILNDIFKILETITSPFHYIFKRKFSHYLYQKSIIEILTSVDDEKLRGWYSPCDLIDAKEFRGMINSLFQPGDYHFSTMDIAVAINIATGHYCDNEFNKLSHEIIDFSYHLSREIKESIIKSKVMRDGLIDYGKNISLMDTNSDRAAIEYLFKNKKDLFLHYFSTFNNTSYNHRVQIWHQGNDNTWIDWAEKNSIYININPYKIREGFFLVGFDYRDITNNKSLHVASNKDGYEYFNKCLKNSSYVWMQ
ncbi:hypothetical protein [Serratia fonticola]|uniref:hypothetical protein n=1 Tax=Serratia fonticola TaxID=47917 RepID=UPI00280015E4|nr:hypothetical protein [Serratia fonticola]MDQ7208913.1 hypothetical protein [Serratia fonticola]HBE9078990.1 hypothetical protein [Serratia fonticola]HBE9089479.1 hypothetical protein [Serratia fonticola]HBE9152199.1 hypothetical protein [Serratia fonticola]